MEEQSILSKDFPTKLKQLRNSKGWSQGQLANQIGIEANRVSKYERGVLWPTLELMVRIAKAFNVSVDYLVRDDRDIAINKIQNQQLLQQLEQLDDLPKQYQETLVSVLEAFIKRYQLEKLVQS